MNAIAKVVDLMYMCIINKITVYQLICTFILLKFSFIDIHTYVCTYVCRLILFSKNLFLCNHELILYLTQFNYVVNICENS